MLPALVPGIVVSLVVPAPIHLVRPAARPTVARVAMLIEDDACVDEVCGVTYDADPPEQSKAPWYREGSAYAEESRKFRRTVYMHDEWVKHRSSERFFRNLNTLSSSGVGKALKVELAFVTGAAVFCVLMNMLFTGYTDFSGVVQEAPLAAIGKEIGPISLPALPFTIAMPALSLLLVFRTNTAYARWNEARTLWGGVINTCRNVARQGTLYFPAEDAGLTQVLAADTAAFAKALRNFLRGPSDDDALAAELEELVAADLMSPSQLEACMAAGNRPMYCISAMSAVVREAKIGEMDRARIDTSISTLVDLTGACERIFKSPVPLVYTRHTSRFLAVFLLFLPFGLWPAMASSWNHWTTVPAADMIAFFLLGIEEIGIQIEEPFSVLPIEAFCNGAIAATMEQMVNYSEGVVPSQPSAKPPAPAPDVAEEASPPHDQEEESPTPVREPELGGVVVKTQNRQKWKAPPAWRRE